jgi:hypothetical protein
LEFVKFSRAQHIGSRLDEFSNDVEGVVDGTIMLVNILFDLLQCIDLILQSIDILNRDVLTCDLTLNLLQPFVQLVQILVGLSELLLDGLLHGKDN